jgi:rhodanese-related sulfurtransferase
VHVASPADSIHRLPAQRAFLVQVHAEAEVAQGRLAGRVEHVVSGQATHFASPEELLAFMARVLTPLDSPRASPGAAGSEV